MKHVTINAQKEAFVAKTEEEAYEFCKDLFIKEIQKAILAKGRCCIAISGGKTPLPLFEKLTEPQTSILVNWPLVSIFWIDERTVAKDHPQSNFGNAETFFSTPPLDRAKKYRLSGENENREAETRAYEQTLMKNCSGEIDVALLGIGDDGHTASLFPHSQALLEKSHIYVPNFIKEKNEWRLTITFPGLELVKKTIVLCVGKGKSRILKKVFDASSSPEEIPAIRLGSSEKPAIFILDKKSAYGLGL